MRILRFVLAVLMLTACTAAPQPEPQPEPTPQPQPPTPTPDPPKPTEYGFTADPSSLTFDCDGGTQTFQLSTEAAWKAYCKEDWITFVHQTGQGDDEIIVTVEPYYDTEYNRRGTISFEVDGEGTGGIDIDIVQLRCDHQVPPDPPDPPVTNVKVTTGSASKITTTSANITCNYSGADAGVYDRGVFYGYMPDRLDYCQAISSSELSSGYFTIKLTSLEPNTTYYYAAFVTVFDAASNQYVDVLGSVLSFSTEDGMPVTVNGLQYLDCYEIPALSLVRTDACSNTGGESFGNTSWFNYETTNADQMVITHTFADGNKVRRNYTCLVDRTKQAPLWSAFVMHDDVYPDNNIGRTGSWTPDPGIPASWQSCFSSSGYSRGHFVASNYRQNTSAANKQTFYYTNQALQYQTSFNDGVWNSLEQAVKGAAPSGRDTLYVVVGTLYENSRSIEGVPVPSHFYKLLMKCSFSTAGTMTDARGVAYLFTNESHKGMTYSQGATTIDAVEQRAGFNFFANVPEELQEKAEKMSSGIW